LLHDDCLLIPPTIMASKVASREGSDRTLASLVDQPSVEEQRIKAAPVGVGIDGGSSRGDLTKTPSKLEKGTTAGSTLGPEKSSEKDEDVKWVEFEENGE
jgi:hypothetical protein